MPSLKVVKVLLHRDCIKVANVTAYHMFGQQANIYMQFTMLLELIHRQFSLKMKSTAQRQLNLNSFVLKLIAQYRETGIRCPFRQRFIVNYHRTVIMRTVKTYFKIQKPANSSLPRRRTNIPQYSPHAYILKGKYYVQVL